MPKKRRSSRKANESGPRRGPAPDYSAVEGGGALLAKAIGEAPGAQRAAAAKIGITPQLLNHLIHGRKGPGVGTAIKIRDAYNVPIDAWATSD
jgi:plasmid maintenance system antidote protein VapI